MSLEGLNSDVQGKDNNVAPTADINYKAKTATARKIHTLSQYRQKVCPAVSTTPIQNFPFNHDSPHDRNFLLHQLPAQHQQHTEPNLPLVAEAHRQPRDHAAGLNVWYRPPRAVQSRPPPSPVPLATRHASSSNVTVRFGGYPVRPRHRRCRRRRCCCCPHADSYPVRQRRATALQKDRLDGMKDQLQFRNESGVALLFWASGAVELGISFTKFKNAKI